MSEFAAYLKRNIKIAAKSVRYNLKKYLPFFAALLIAETFFGFMLFTSDRSAVSEDSIKEETCGYHFVLRRLNDSQHVYLLKYSEENSPGSSFSIVEERDSSLDSFNRLTDVYIRLNGDTDNSYNLFVSRYMPSLSSLADKKAPTPEKSILMQDGNSAGGHTLLYRIILAVLSFAVLTLLYNIRINNYKFEYGIYMSCGADFRKLSENAIFEMLIIVFAMFPPSVLLSLVASLILQGGITVKFGSILKMLLVSLIFGLGAVFFPMLTVSKIYPMKHISAADNSNYVSSPRLSFNMSGKRMKRHYEPFSLFRFRKYYIIILVVTSLFPAVACTVFYGSRLLKQKESAVSPEFSLLIDEDGTNIYDAELARELYSLGGIAYTKLNITQYAEDITSHVAFVKGETKAFSDFAKARQNGLSYVYDSVKYNFCTEEELSYIKTFDLVGDVSAVTENGNYVIVNQNIKNAKRLKLEPGDKIYIGLKKGYNPLSSVTSGDLMFLTGRPLLSAKIELYDFDYVEMTVAAVITDMPSNDYLEIFMSEDAFRSVVYAVTDEPAEEAPIAEETDALEDAETEYSETDAAETEVPPEDTPEEEDEGEYVPEDLRELVTSVDIYVSPELDTEGIKKLGDSLRAWVEGYGGGMTVVSNNAQGRNLVLRAEKLPGVCTVISVLILLFTPIIWLFAQIVFYKKRYPEMNMLTAIGGIFDEIKNIFVTDGVILAALSAILTAGFGTGFILILYKAANYFAAMEVSLGVSVFYKFVFPWVPLIAAVLISSVLAFLSVAVTYDIYRKSVSDVPRSFSEE